MLTRHSSAVRLIFCMFLLTTQRRCFVLQNRRAILYRAPRVLYLVR